MVVCLVINAGLADDLLMNHAFTTSDQVVIKTLNSLDARQACTPFLSQMQTVWILKRASPTLYAKALGIGYPLFNNTSNKLRVDQDDNRNNFSYAA